jgi:Flp pilus assembly protein TadB
MLKSIWREVDLFFDWTLGDANTQKRYRHSNELVLQSGWRFTLGLFVGLALLALMVWMSIEIVLWVPSSVRIVGVVALLTLGAVKLLSIYIKRTAELRQLKKDDKPYEIPCKDKW